MSKRAKAAGILNGKPFETLCSKDLDWLRFTAKELDLYRWKGKICNLCKGNLSTEHLKICVGLEKERDLIKHKTGIEASVVLEDPSVLNKRSKMDVNILSRLLQEGFQK